MPAQQHVARKAPCSFRLRGVDRLAVSEGLLADEYYRLVGRRVEDLDVDPVIEAGLDRGLLCFVVGHQEQERACLLDDQGLHGGLFWVSTMNDPLIPDLREDIESRQDDMVGFLEALVRAESPSVVPESQRGVQALLASSLCDSGFHVRVIRGRGKSGGLLYASPRGRLRPHRSSC